MMRLDKFLAHAHYGTRREVKKIIRKGWVSVNHHIVKDDDYKVDEVNDVVCVDDEIVHYQSFYYIMLNKPVGYVSATMDERYPTVLELIQEEYAFDLFPVGRLDVDTEGLLLLTNDGPLAHNLLSPKKHVDKEYYVQLEQPYHDADVMALEQGIAINDEEVCQPAHVKKVDETTMHLVIQEGKFHQVKRMMHAIHNEVTYLKRIRMGSLQLDETLASGQYRVLTTQEVEALKGA